jgi:hypothetical protein
MRKWLPVRARVAHAGVDAKGYLKWYETVTEQQQQICVYIKNGNNSVAELAAACDESGSRAGKVKLTLAVRWRTESIQSSWMLEHADEIKSLPRRLRPIASTRARPNSEEVFALIDDDKFWDSLALGNEFDNKFAEICVRQQSNDATMVDVYCARKEVYAHFDELVKAKSITKPQRTELRRMFDERWNGQAYHGLPELAAVIDPRMVPGMRPGAGATYAHEFMPTTEDYEAAVPIAQECLRELQRFFCLNDSELDDAIEVITYMQVNTESQMIMCMTCRRRAHLQQRRRSCRAQPLR